MSREFAEVIRDTDNEEDVLQHIEFGDMVLAAIRERRISAPDGWDYSCRRGGILFYPHEDIISKSAKLIHDDGSPSTEPRDYTLFGVLILDTPEALEEFKDNPFLKGDKSVEVSFGEYEKE